MRKRSLTPLGETEMEILHEVWELGRATVANVRERIARKRPVAYTTIMTIMRNLAEKGYLKYEKQGATFLYTAARRPDEVQHSLVKDLVTKVFAGSPLALVQSLVKHEDLSQEERKELQDLIKDLESHDRKSP